MGFNGLNKATICDRFARGNREHDFKNRIGDMSSFVGSGFK